MTSQIKPNEDLGRQASPLRDWTTFAAVRTKPSLTTFDAADLSGELRNVRWFVLGASDPLMAHPMLNDLGIAERNLIYAERLTRFLDEMTLTEHRIINSSAQIVAENRFSDFFSEELALDALKLYTDEGYHAYFTGLMSQTIREACGILRTDEARARVSAIEALVESTPIDRRDMMWFMVGFVGETMITKSIVDIMRSTANSSIQAILLAHLEDEWMHSKYFSHLFELVWPRLGNSDKEYFGALLPKIIGVYHTFDPVFHSKLIAKAGININDSRAIVEEVFNAKYRSARTRSMCRNTLQTLDRCGVFESESVRMSFVHADLVG